MILPLIQTQLGTERPEMTTLFAIPDPVISVDPGHRQPPRSVPPGTQAPFFHLFVTEADAAGGDLWRLPPRPCKNAD